ncbi:MAG: hypothetical protein WCN88_04685 [Candidatus Falkowbacteria bacterium]
MITPYLKSSGKVKKEKKPRKQKTEKQKLQEEADKLYQEVGRELNDSCLICGGEYSCLHHFIRKSQSTALRYDLENGIPICHICHCRIHTGQDSSTTARIVLIKGIQWFEMIDARKRLGLGLNYGITWYKAQYERLKLLK